MAVPSPRPGCGGVLLIHDFIHDFIRIDALADALSRMADDPAVRVVGIDRAVERKYGRPVAHLAAALGADGADGARVTIL